MSSAAKVGLFMLVVLGILGFFILKIEEVKLNQAAEMKTVTATFDTVAGLDEKSAVRVAGVRVGKVVSIRLEAGHAVVTMLVDREVELHAGASARVANLGLLGEKFIEILPGPPAAPILSETQETKLGGDRVPTLDDVTVQISKIADDIKSVTESMKATMGGNSGEQRLQEIVENIHQITARVNRMLAANEGNATATAENLRKITEDLRVEIPRIADSIDHFAGSVGGTFDENRTDVKDVVQNLKGLSTELRTTADNLNGITGQVKSGEGTVGKLIYDDEAHRKLISALDSVEKGVGELSETLGHVRKIDMAVEVRSAYMGGLEEGNPELGLDGNSRSGLAVLFRPDRAKNRFLQFEMNQDPRGKRNEKLTETTVVGPDGSTATTTTHQVKYDQGFLFSAQAGWQIDKTKLRVGIFDGTGGVGADYMPTDRIQLTTEIFDFNSSSRNVDPHVRVFGNYTLFKERPSFPMVFLTGGVDNALNDTAYTIGGGIRWGDEDLKYLLGSVKP